TAFLNYSRLRIEEHGQVPEISIVFSDRHQMTHDDRRVRPRFPFIDVFRRSLFVPRTQTFNRNRVQLTIGCPIGPNSSASTERLMRWIECAFEREKSPE